MITDNILALLNKTPESILISIAGRVKLRRLDKNWTQKLLASKAGIPLATYRRFELKGEISLRGLSMVAIALGLEGDFESLFSTKSYQSMDELLESNKTIERKRGTTND